MLRVIFSIYFWLYFIFSAFFYFPILIIIWLLTFLFDRELKILHLYSCFWASSYFYISPPWKVKFKGREKIEKDQTYVLIANHNSPEDILVLYGLYKHFKWVSKVENIRIPIFGWVMFFNRYILIERTSRSSIKKMLSDCEKNLKKGNSVLLFPEGTRSRNGEIGSFKDGAFKMAQNAKVPIIPIAVSGTENNIIRGKGVMRGRQTIMVEVLDAIAPEKFENRDTREIARDVRSLMITKLNELKSNDGL